VWCLKRPEKAFFEKITSERPGWPGIIFSKKDAEGSCGKKGAVSLSRGEDRTLHATGSEDGSMQPIDRRPHHDAGTC